MNSTKKKKVLFLPILKLRSARHNCNKNTTDNDKKIFFTKIDTAIFT